MAYFDPTTNSDFNTLLKRFEFWIHHAPERILRQPIADLEFKIQPGKWSKKEICGHLVDSAINNLQRFTGAIHAEESYELFPYPQNALVQINAYQKQAADEIMQLWQSLNLQIFRIVSTVEEHHLAKAIIMTTTGNQYDLKWLISDYICHLEHHLKQLFSLEATDSLDKDWILSLLESEEQLKAQEGSERFITLMQEGKMSVELYAPEKVDGQSPHQQDELYVVESGHGIFFRAGERIPFKAGDVIYVPAHIEHRFEAFSDNFKTWVIFY